MRDIIKEDILSVLKEAIEILETKEHPAQALGELSNHVIHDASIFQDDDSTSMAVLVYALAKTVANCCEKRVDYKTLIPHIKKAHELLSKDDYDNYRTAIKAMFKKIAQLGEKIRIYIQEVLDAARIKKGSKMHAHGISIARTAEILGITQWELQDYIGKQEEWKIKEMPVTQRLKIAREIFK